MDMNWSKLQEIVKYCRKRDTSQGSRVGSCLTLGNGLSEETHVLMKQETLLGKGTWEESHRVKEPGELLYHVARGLRFYGDGIRFWVVLSQSFWLRVLSGSACIAQPRWMPVRRILGGGQTCGVSFWAFLNSFGWWWLVSSAFLPRTSCHKIIHTNGY